MRQMRVGAAIVVAVLLGLIVGRPIAAHFGGEQPPSPVDDTSNVTLCPASTPDACLALLGRKAQLRLPLPGVRLPSAVKYLDGGVTMPDKRVTYPGAALALSAGGQKWWLDIDATTATRPTQLTVRSANGRRYYVGPPQRVTSLWFMDHSFRYS